MHVKRRDGTPWAGHLDGTEDAVGIAPVREYRDRLLENGIGTVPSSPILVRPVRWGRERSTRAKLSIDGSSPDSRSGITHP
jgi:hypothetical protein